MQSMLLNEPVHGFCKIKFYNEQGFDLALPYLHINIYSKPFVNSCDSETCFMPTELQQCVQLPS